jgi:hypothetical protein
LALPRAIVSVALGAVALGLGTAASIVRATADVPEPPDGQRDPASAIAGAALGFMSEASRTAGALAEAALRALRPVAVAGAAVTEPARRGASAAVRRWEATWEEERPEAEALATAIAAEATRRAVVAILGQLDLTELAVERIDLDRIAAELDVDAIAARIDLDALMRRVDLDAVADGIDVERIVARLDLSVMALDVIERIDLPEIIRASTGAVSSETVRTVRMDAVAADDAVARVVGRLLRRRTEDGG